ncbi:class I SAM-dependent methyltransferase [Vandammella animalimorsus]|uniref:SAM-dependent methyltransferase n=1 Tax=Vandammella animalimorsus TaxID=2029117 RepID=A0A2A2AZY6_9BURK|nr:class I SAM-dependent methyltransferase [Vandammella animalimorsus]PAT43264.1 SAM-dependent methyltransferase [Vandammella animalimorsus]
MAMPQTRFDEWLQTSAAGLYVRQWQQRHYAHAVQDVFGYYALHIGVASIAALQTSRIAHTWRLAPQWPGGDAAADLYAAPEALPFADNQLDLIVMPHGLELSCQPHAVLREATRTLRPEGRLIISGFNPARLLLGARAPRRVQPASAAIGHQRLRDWLTLLGLELQKQFFGCHIPNGHRPQWYERLAWIDRWLQDRLPVFSGVYFIVAVKKVHGARLIGPQWRPQPASAAATALQPTPRTAQPAPAPPQIARPSSV